MNFKNPLNPACIDLSIIANKPKCFQSSKVTESVFQTDYHTFTR